MAVGRAVGDGEGSDVGDGEGSDVAVGRDDVVGRGEGFGIKQISKPVLKP